MGHLEVLDSTFYQVSENVQAVRELFVQGLNGTNSNDEIDAMQREINERARTVIEIAENTKVINGSWEYIANSGSGGFAYNNFVQTGTKDSEGFRIDYNTDFLVMPVNPDGISINPENGNIRPTINQFVKAGTSLPNLRIPGASIGSHRGETTGSEVSQDFDEDALVQLDSMLSEIARMQSVYSADQKRLEEAYSYLEGQEISLNKSLSHFQDTDFAQETANFIKAQIQQQTAGSMVSQANAQAEFVLNLLP